MRGQRLWHQMLLFHCYEQSSILPCILFPLFLLFPVVFTAMFNRSLMLTAMSEAIMQPIPICVYNQLWLSYSNLQHWSKGHDSCGQTETVQKKNNLSTTFQGGAKHLHTKSFVFFGEITLMKKECEKTSKKEISQ